MGVPARYIIVPVADIYKDHAFSSEVITQALMFERVGVIDSHDNWSKIEQWDGYQGWINNFYLDKRTDDDLDECTNHIYVRSLSECVWRSEVDYSNKYKAEVLPYGVRVPYLGRGGDYFESQYLNPKCRLAWDIPHEGPHHKPGRRWVEDLCNEVSVLSMAYFYKEEVEDGVDVENKHIRFCIIEDLYSLRYSPYKWGGKSSFGFDCSGLVQTVFRVHGISMPRDSKEQYSLIRNNQVELNDAKTGDLLFFKENQKVCHVGIYIGDLKFIHCSGMVKENSLDEEDELFDKKLMDKFVGIFCISELIQAQIIDRLDEIIDKYI